MIVVVNAVGLESPVSVVRHDPFLLVVLEYQVPQLLDKLLDVLQHHVVLIVPKYLQNAVLRLCATSQKEGDAADQNLVGQTDVVCNIFGGQQLAKEVTESTLDHLLLLLLDVGFFSVPVSSFPLVDG